MPTQISTLLLFGALMSTILPAMAQSSPLLRSNATAAVPTGGPYVPPASLYDNGQSDGSTSLASQNSASTLTARTADDFRVASGNCASGEFEIARIRMQLVQADNAAQPFSVDLYADAGAGTAPTAGITPLATFAEGVRTPLGPFGVGTSIYEISFPTPGLRVDGNRSYWLSGYGSDGAANTAGFNTFFAASAGAAGTPANGVLIAPGSGVANWTPVQQVVGGNPLAFSFAVDGSCRLRQADLAITQTLGAGGLVPGTTAAYTVVASNLGPETAIGATVVDVLAPPLTACTWTCSGSGGGSCAATGAGSIADSVNLPSGGAATYHIQCALPASAVGVVSNSASVSVSSATIDPNPANNAVTLSDPLTPQADLGITLADAPDPVTAGTALTYTAVVTNAGPSDASGVAIALPLPASTSLIAGAVGGGGSCAGNPVVCTVSGSIVPGGTRVATVVLALAAAAPPGGSVSAMATVAGAASDANVANNSANAGTLIVGSADLALSLSASASQALREVPVTFTATSQNLGPSDAQSVVVTLTLTADLRLASFTADALSSCVAPQVGASGAVVCTWAGATVPQATRTVQVTAYSGVEGLVAVNASTAATTPDPVPTNNLGNTSVQIGYRVEGIPALSGSTLVWMALLLGVLGGVATGAGRREA